MITHNEIEQIIRLIKNGFDLELLSFELEIPIMKLEEYKEQLELRKFVKKSIKSGKIEQAIEKLTDFIQKSENNIVEKLMLVKLKAYVERRNISEKEINDIEEEKKKIGFTRNIDEILNELEVQIPKRKTCNLKKKEKKEEIIEENIEETTRKYDLIIKKYKEEIKVNPQKALNERNLLAFAYFKAGKINEAREELLELIEKHSSHTAYRQLVHLERSQENLDDAKLLAYDALEKFPDSIAIREQLISIARKENDIEEEIKQLKEIIAINPKNNRNCKRLRMIKEER